MKVALGLIMAACMATGLFWQPAHADVQEALSACDQGQLSEEGECTDVDDVAEETEQVGARGAFPSISCRIGYFQVGPRLCMTGTRGPNSFSNAEVDCQDILGRVADYADWRYRIFRGDGIPAPVGFWLGPITADNTALFVNLPNVGDFDGEASRFDSRGYVCAHDDNG